MVEWAQHDLGLVGMLKRISQSPKHQEVDLKEVDLKEVDSDWVGCLCQQQQGVGVGLLSR